MQSGFWNIQRFYEQNRKLVFTQIAPDSEKNTLQAIIRYKIDIRSVINTVDWQGYNGLADIGYNKHSE